MSYTLDWEVTLFTEEPLKKKLLRNGFWLYFFAFIAAPAWYIAKVIVSRELSVEDIWLFYSILWVISLLATYNDLWLTEALQYYLPHYLIDKEYWKAKSVLVMTLYTQLISWILIWWLTFFLAPWLATAYFKSPHAINILQIFSIYYLILNFFQVLQSLFIATQHVKWSQWVEAVRMWAIVLFVGLWSFMNNFSVSLYTMYWLLWIIFATCVCIIWWYKHFRWLFTYKTVFDWQLFLKQRRYAFWIMIWTNATILLAAVDQQLALYFFWTKWAGYWTNYLSLLNIIHVVSMPLIWYLFPLLNELRKKQEREKIRYLNKLLYMWFISFGVLIWILFYIRWPDIAVLFFGDKFIESGKLLRTVAPFVFLIPLIGVAFQNLASSWLAKQRVYVLLLWVAVTILWSLIFIDRFQLWWIIYWTVCWQIIMILSAQYILQKHQ